MNWSGKTPRKWQADALPVILDALHRGERGIVSAVMGAGKSILQAEVAANVPGSCVVVAPRQELVRQLGATFAERLGADEVGLYFAESKQIRRVTVCCAASLPYLAPKVEGADLLIADEVHGSESARLLEAIPAVRAKSLVGFTATPFRSRPSQSISLFDKILYRYTMSQALSDGCLVPMRHVRYEGTHPGGVDAECLEMIRQHGEGPGIVSADSIEDAEEYAAWLTERKIVSEAIHSGNSGPERAEKLSKLHGGAIRALVHVSLLAEGMDLPWLRWLCLRRKVGARVRFLQEVGRVLRVHPGKVEGVVMDPHLLLGKHGLTTAEAIGVAMEEAANLEGDRQRAETERKEAEVVALDLLTACLAEVREAMESAALIGPRWVGTPGWEIAGVSDKQVAAIEKARKGTRHIPQPWRGAVKALAHVPWALTRGQASDLISVLIGGSDWARKKAGETGAESYMLQWSPRVVRGVVSPDESRCRMVERMKP